MSWCFFVWPIGLHCLGTRVRGQPWRKRRKRREVVCVSSFERNSNSEKLSQIRSCVLKWERVVSRSRFNSFLISVSQLVFRLVFLCPHLPYIVPVTGCRPGRARSRTVTRSLCRRFHGAPTNELLTIWVSDNSTSLLCTFIHWVLMSTLHLRSILLRFEKHQSWLHSERELFVVSHLYSDCLMPEAVTPKRPCGTNGCVFSTVSWQIETSGGQTSCPNFYILFTFKSHNSSQSSSICSRLSKIYSDHLVMQNHGMRMYETRHMENWSQARTAGKPNWRPSASVSPNWQSLWRLQKTMCFERFVNSDLTFVPQEVFLRLLQFELISSLTPHETNGLAVLVSIQHHSTSVLGQTIFRDESGFGIETLWSFLVSFKIWSNTWNLNIFMRKTSSI